MGKRRKWLALVLSTAMTFTGLPAASLQPVSAEATNLLASFDFNSEAENGFFSGGNAKAEVKGGAKITALVEGDSALSLNGSDAYLSVTKADGSSLLKGKSEISVSYDALPKSGNGWVFFAQRTADATQYQFEHYLGVMHKTGSIAVERYNSNGDRSGESVGKSTDLSAWNHIDITFAEGVTKVYINGELADSKDAAYTLPDILEGSELLQIGKAEWGSEYYGGLVDNLRIYDGVISADEIAANYSEFQTAQAAINEANAESNKPINVAYDSVVILNQDDVRTNLPLVKKTANGADVAWTSSNPAVISDSADANSLYDGGVVTRPAAGAQAVSVKLTATITLGEESRTKEFDVTVTPKTANLDTDYSAGYLWSMFEAEGGYEKIFFGYSKDGLTWSKLNKRDGAAKPILVNDGEGSDLGVRDPHIIRSPEGDKYWILGTDLHAEGGGSGGSGWNQTSASKNIVVWESNDLVNWSEPRIVYSGFKTAGCVWAPEAIYDDATGDYLVYWSIRDTKNVDTEQNALRVYVCRTRDFNTFTEPKVWLSEDQDSGKEVNIIDTTITKGDDGKYYRFSTSDWNTIIDVSDTLDDNDVLDVRTSETASTPKGSWTRIVNRSGAEAAGFDSREGFTVYKLPDGRWCAMGDHSGYKAFVTDDLASGKFTAADATFKDGRFRHGTVMRLSKAEENALLEAFEEQNTPGLDEEEAQEPVLEYTFENESDASKITDTGTGNAVSENGTLYGKAKVVYDEERKSNVLELDGSSGGYAAFPQGFFDKRNVMTVSMDVKSLKDSGNFFTFAFGKNNTFYNFMRVRGTEVRNAMTVTSWQNEQEVKGAGASVGQWQNVVLVFNGATMKLYLDGTLVSENNSTGLTVTSLGTDLLGYLGKSFYSDDGYFKGSFDNVQVYNRVLSEDEIIASVIEKVNLVKSVQIGTVPTDPDNTKGTDDHTASVAKLNKETKVITSYVNKNADLTALPLTVNVLTKDAQIQVNGEAFTNGSTVDLSQDATLTVTYGERTESYTVKTPQIAYNPVLPGQYADPDIDYLAGKYWIYPTTDGFSGWGGWEFHAWSSTDLRNWTDEGVILDVKNDDPGVNAKGVQIAASAWSDGNAWAPTIEEKDGKYYFYYCGNEKSTNRKAVGVAVADNPAGPFVAKDTPIVNYEMANSACGFTGQVIDPSIFKDDDGTYYFVFGNGSGNAVIAELNDDMMSVKTETMHKVNGLNDFRESLIITKRDGVYHFTWSCDDAGSPNYHVNYGIANSLNETVTFKYTLLKKDESGDMLGTAHHSILYMPDTGKYYIAYHRFYTPLGIYTSGLGYHRTTCVDELTFNEETGLMNKVTPTMEGAYAPLPENEDPGKEDPGKDDPTPEDPGKEDPGKDDPTPDNPGKDDPGKTDPTTPASDVPYIEPGGASNSDAGTTSSTPASNSTSASTGTGEASGDTSKANETTKDGMTVPSTTTVVTGKDGTKVEKTKIAEIADGASAVVAVSTDASGNVTDVSAKVTETIPVNTTKATITGDMVSNLVAASGKNDVEIVMDVKNTVGDIVYTVKAAADDLKSGNELCVYKQTDDGEFVMVNAKTYKVSEAGNVDIDVSEQGVYKLVSIDEAKAIDEKIEKTVKLAKKSTTLKKSKTTKIRLSKILNMDNVKSVSFSSAKKSVATVTKNGTVKARKAGKVTIAVKVTLKNGTKKTLKYQVKVK